MLAEQLRMHENFGSEYLGTARNVVVYLPPGYDVEVERRYPVLYMNDGQNLFRPEDSFGGVAWGVDETAHGLILAGQVDPLIIVGIYNTPDRIDEYTHVKAVRGKMKGRGGRADDYGRMLIDELKPFIDREYRTRPERESTGLGGSSLGGLVSLYLSLKYPEVFSRIGVLSPSAWWANNQIIRDAALIAERLPLRIWLDIGKREGSGIKHQVRALKEILLANGWKNGEDLAYFEIPDAGHDETAWAQRFGEVLRFLYPVF
ncbi:MAG: alpha/beta hydrolase-fold protein [Acidobacteriota bacterium]